MIRYRTLLFSIISALTIAIAGCEDTPTTTPSERTTFGTASTISGGTVRSFVKVDRNGNPLEMGLRLSATTVNGMTTSGGDHEHDNMYEIALPSEASKTPVQHISLDWNPHGHEPAMVYDTAHFDMHFYTVAKSERMTWSMQGADSARMVKTPDSTLIPAGYATNGMGVPYMGLHYVDVTSGEFNGKKFNSTFIWGYYNGQQAFIEPMITQWYLQSKTSHTQTLALPARYTKTGLYYPTTYTIRFDDATKEHVITLGGMLKR